MALPELTADMSSMAMMSPNKFAAISALRLYEKFFDYMSMGENVNVERMIAALIVSCPEEKQRDLMWEKYIKERDATGGSVTKAAIYAAGTWYQYMSNAMGLYEQSTGGG